MFVVENRPDESFFSRLDSNLKKNTAFVKKLVSLLDYLYIRFWLDAVCLGGGGIIYIEL